MFKKRIGLDPHRDGRETNGGNGCPDVWELEDGSIAVIGLEQTSTLEPHLPPTAGRGSDESIVVIPRELLLHIKSFIPDE